MLTDLSSEASLFNADPQLRLQAEPRTLIEGVYRKLRRDIIECRHAPGDKLRVEHLKATYQVSGGTLREALSLLVSDSLVVSEGQRGFRVAPMSLADIEDLTRTRVLLECASLRESMQLGKDDWEAAVISAFHRLSRAEERLVSASTFDDWEERNRQFHEALVSACPSPWMHRLRAVLYHQSERYRRLSAMTAPPASRVHQEHRGIFKAVMARDIERASAALESHIYLSLKLIKARGLLDQPATEHPTAGDR